MNPGEGRILWQQPVEKDMEGTGKDDTEKQYSEKKRAAFSRSMKMEFTIPQDIRFLSFRHPAEDMLRIVSKSECGLKCANAAPEDTKGEISYLGLRQQGRDFSIKVQVQAEMPGESGAGLLYLYNDDNYLFLSLDRQGERVTAVLYKREKGTEQILGSRVLEEGAESPESAWIELEIRGADQKAEFLVQGERLGVVSVGFMSAECADGFVGCTYGIHARGTGEGYAQFRDLQVEYGADEGAL